MTQPDPDPRNTPGLEPGGGVPPGETPPGESAISGVSHPEDPPGKLITPIALIAIAVVVGLVVLYVIARAVALF